MRKKMTDVELGLLRRDGETVRLALGVVAELAKSPLADEDSQDESPELQSVKELIVRARTLVHQGLP